MNEEMKKFTIEMVEKSFELKQKGVDMFVELSPHCDLVNVRFYDKGWAENTESDFGKNVFWGKYKSESIEEIRKYLEKFNEM